MTQETDPLEAISWKWQDYLSTYRFWVLVLANVLLGFAFYLMPRTDTSFWTEIEHPYFRMMSEYYVLLIPILIILYFFRRRVKLILFILLAFVLLGALAATFKNNLPDIIVFVLSSLGGFSRSAFLIAIVAILVQGRPTMASFIIVYSIVLVWQGIGWRVGLRLYEANSYEPVPWLAIALLVLACIALVFVSGTFFSNPPETRVEAKTPKERHPVAVFLFSAFVPFYFLYWLSQRPGEYKSVAPDLRQPTPAGAVCIGLFAPFILPIWFHDIRRDLASRLSGRSGKLLAVMMFFIPTIGAARAQSDTNLLMKDGQSTSTFGEDQLNL